jgi:hypothetical protein
METGLTVSRFVVLALSLVGIVAMHGLASDDASGRHCMSFGVTMASEPHSAASIAHVLTQDDVQASGPLTHTALGDVAAVPTVGPILTPGDQDDGHGMMTACVAILLSMLVALALRLLRMGRGADTLRTSTHRWYQAAAARAPPRPLFLSLCVFRT